MNSKWHIEGRPRVGNADVLREVIPTGKYSNLQLHEGKFANGRVRKSFEQLLEDDKYIKRNDTIKVFGVSLKLFKSFELLEPLANASK